MKRCLLFFLMFFILINTVFSEKSETKKKKDYLTMKITPDISLLNGTINEYVFSKSCMNANNKLSELVWDIKNVQVFNLTADFDILNYLYTGLKGSFVIPCKSGYMQDFDWLNSTTSKWKSDDPCAITNYSKHDNKITKYLLLSIRLGGNIFLPAEIKLTPFIEYQYEYIGFEGSNGFYIYKSDNYNPGTFSGKVISYSQEMNSFLAGLKFSIDCVPRTSFYGDFGFSPALSFINAMDYHYKNTSGYGTAYWDNLSLIWLIKANLGVQYKFNKKHSSGISGSLQIIPEGKGKTSNVALGANGLPSYARWSTSASDSGGTKRLLWSISLNYSFSL